MTTEPTTTFDPEHLGVTAEFGERIAKLRENTQTDLRWRLNDVEKNADKVINEFLDRNLVNIIREFLGVDSFNRVKEGSVLARILTPHLERITQKWADAYFSKNRLPKELIATAMAGFRRGYDNGVAGISYKIGQEIAKQHEDKIRAELLGYEEYVRLIEKKMTDKEKAAE